MAIDQNVIPNDLRPWNLNRTVVDEPTRVPVPATVVRDVSSPRSRPVFFPTAAAVSADPNYVGLGFGNPPITNPNFGGLGFGNPMAVWCCRPPEPIPATAPVLVPASAPAPAPAVAPCSEIPNFGNRIGGNNSDFGADESSDDQSASKKVKVLCSFGGKILPRPGDGMLRYVGGQTRIITVKRDINFQDLMQKISDTCGHPVIIKYQLPDEDLDALVSVSCGEDLENMMEEYQKLVETLPEGSAKIRTFLFSANELDQSVGILHSSDVSDSAQRYVDAINGITEGTVGIRRKDSVATALSTQSSDGPVSGGEAIDKSGVGQGDSDATSSLLSGYRDSTKLVYFAPPNAVNHPTVVSGPPQNLPLARTEHESERTAMPPNGQPMAYDFQSTTVGFPQGTVYVQTYVDPRQEGFNRVDYLHNSFQIAYTNNHPMGIGGSGYRRADHPSHPPQQLPESVVGLPPPHPFVPALQVSNASSPQVIMRPYVEESSYGSRVVQVPIDQNHRTYQAHPVPVPTTMSQGQVFEHYGWAPQQLEILPDCYMCQKGLPHTHSDTLIQEHGNTIKSSVSETSPVFSSEETMISRPSYKGVSGALVDGMFEHQMGHFGFTQIPDENERIRLQKGGSHDHVRMLNPQNVMGLPGESPSYGKFAHQEDALQQQPPVPSLYQIKQNVSMNKSVGIDTPPVRNVPFQASEPHVRECAVDYAGKPPCYSPREEVLDSYFSCDNLRPINGRIEGMHIGPAVISGINDQSVPPVKHNFNVSKEPNPETVPLVIKNGFQITEPFGLSNVNIAREEIHDNKSQVAGTEMYVMNPFIKPGILPDGNYGKPIDPLPSSSSEVTGHAPCPHLKVGVELVMSDELWHGKPVFSCLDTAYNDKIPVGEWKDEALRFQSRAVLHNQVSTAVSSDAPFSLPSSSSASSPLGDNSYPKVSNTLFSNQDPWNLRQDTHLLPPKCGQVAVKEGFFPKDLCNDNQLGNSDESSTTLRLDERGFHQLPVTLSKDSCLEPVQPVRGSAEERIKQELKAVAEGVAASVLESSIPPPVSVLSIGEMNETITEADRDTEVHDSDLESQFVEAPVDVKIQDIETKLSDKLNPGFPMKDSIGRLQIIPNSDLEELRELGSGTFGTVYHGKWRGSDVAIKRINDRCFAGKPSEQERMREDFWNEAVKLADLHHPNVVAFYGVVLDGPGGSVATVTEYMVNGSLRHALMRNDRVLDRHKRLLIAMDVAFGMEYLHSKNIVHFDLKSDNLLVNLRDPQRPICKVGDLGLSKVKCQTLISGGVRGTLPWMAPELLNGSSSLVSEKVDVFSFGIVMWELVTGEEPYTNLHYGAIIGGIVSNTLRPPVPESCDPEWKLLMENCWSTDPSGRPSFTEIAGSLRSMAASLPPKGQQSPAQSQAQI